MYSSTLDIQIMFTKMSYSDKVDIIVSMNVYLKSSKGTNDRHINKEQWTVQSKPTMKTLCTNELIKRSI